MLGAGGGLGSDSDGAPAAAVEGGGESDSACMASPRLSVQVVLLAQTRPLGNCRPTNSSRPFMSSCDHRVHAYQLMVEIVIF